ncbi:MAG: Flp pilus assembly protein CpaB [Proteobacteria bacterium]|nr:Flp pilus assembly protein CpaB [Pseudomonadota bacterium]
MTHSITESVDSDTVRRATETVLSDIRVLAVDQRTDDSEGKAALAKTATLEVTPKQAEIISVANELGRLSLSLRSLAQSEATDDLRPAGQAHTWDTEASRLIPRKSSSNVVAVKVVRGGARSSVNFERSGGQGYVVTGGSTQGYVATGGASALQNTATQTVTKSAGAPVNLIQKVN